MDEDDKFFNDFFARFQADLKGSETEILAMRKIARQWYQAGQISMVKKMRQDQQKILLWLNEFPADPADISDLLGRL